MKRKSDPRHQKRVRLVKNLFSWNFHKNQFLNDETKKVVEALPKIDNLIAIYAPEWPLEQMPPMDLAILRQSVFELLYQKETPYKVVVDEAVEIAKEFGGESSFEFVNGVLGSVVEKELGIRENDG